MSFLGINFKRLALTLGLAGALSAAVAAPAVAADTVTQTITAGTRTASIADLILTAVSYSHADQSSTGTMTLTADDSTGSDLGWNVTVQASDFTSGGDTIAASNFAITTANAPSATAGQAVDATNGPKVPATNATGTLDLAREVIEANAGFGKGTYTQDLDVSLTIPGQTLAGTYISTLTVTISSGPGA